MRKKLTEEEKNIIILEKQKKQEESNMAFSLKSLRDEYIPDPEQTAKYTVGERVQHGNVKQSIVKEVIDNGKIYLLDEIFTNNNYGNPYDTKREIYVPWINLSLYRSAEDNKKIPSFFENDDYRLNFSQRDMQGLLYTHYHFGVDFDPPYQRELVWSEKDKISLIDSCFQRIDIGKFVFIHKKFNANDTSYEILDGKQRMRTLLDYYENKLVYKGFRFIDLCRHDQNEFMSLPISYATVKEENIPQSKKYRYFLRLNTGGKSQTELHMDNIMRLYREALQRENV